MLTIDRVRDVLMADPVIQGSFATYKGQPAIWMKDQAPFDTSEFWTQGEQYPRADLTITTQFFPERQVQGQFAVNVWAKTVQIEAMVKRVIEVLDGSILFSDEGRDSLQWAGTPDGDIEDDLAHFMIMFTLVRMTSGETFGPDPVAVLNRWTAENIEDAFVNPEEWLPLIHTAPAIFWRTLNETSYMHWPAATEYAGDFVAHVIHPNQRTRADMVRKLVLSLANKQGQRIAYRDLKPYLRLDVNGIAYDSNRDPLRVGQVQLSSVMYVIPRPTISVPRITEINYDVTVSVEV